MNDPFQIQFKGAIQCIGRCIDTIVVSESFIQFTDIQRRDVCNEVAAAVFALRDT